MADDLIKYPLENLKAFRDCLSACFDVIEGPDRNDSITRDVNLREKGVTVIVKAKHKLPLLSPATPPHASWENLVALGMQPGLTLQVIDQLVDLMEKQAEG